MMPRKKRIMILIISIILISLLVISGVLGFLYLKTDLLKSNEVLFAKYFMQNFEAVEILKVEDTLGIQSALDNSKFTSEIQGDIEYTENIGTSDENKDNEINNVGINIKSNIDRINNYDYKDVLIGTDDEHLVKLEYLNQDQTYALRLDGIKQFVSIESNEDNQNIWDVENVEQLTSKVDISAILNFTEEEKQSLMNTYLEIIQSNVSKEKYYRQSNTLITVNDKDVQTNAYYIKISIEEYNNLYIKILEQIINDEIILSRLDLIENEIKEKYSDYEQDETLREKFINNISNKIQEIQNTNIGSSEVKIIVYESDGKTVRTSIEKETQKFMIDLYDNSSIKIDNIELGENIKEQYIKIERNNNQIQTDLLVEFQEIEENQFVNSFQLNNQQIFENNEVITTTKISIANQKYEGIFNIVDNIQLVQEFENQITLDTDNIKMSDLSQEQLEIVKGILNENIQGQISNLNSFVDTQDYVEMLENLQIINRNSVELPSDDGITELERKRFNSQFEFFVSENLTSDNIKELMQATDNNFEDMKVLLKNEQIEDLDVEMLELPSEEDLEYINNISEILIFIKQNSNNEDKKEDTLKFVEYNKNSKYDVSIQYDDDGMTRLIRVKIQEEE